mgnify:CR=1 FL=1
MDIFYIRSISKEEEETTMHFLLYCKALRTQRLEHLIPILHILRRNQLNILPEHITKVLMDPTHLACTDEDLWELEHHTRSMCYKLHMQRSQMILEKEEKQEKSRKGDKGDDKGKAKER